ncbi:hypothetical protein MKW98_031731 [Papaver atlanticum]|uniref:Uncharacterized protein n=1 Tax=Papaver atlanticum TaxID=357466 RepID=A0AAD4S5R5_9MAGN|nr:hypothetical protein MKW98_031731 [Papaver atlanticum]
MVKTEKKVVQQKLVEWSVGVASLIAGAVDGMDLVVEMALIREWPVFEGCNGVRIAEKVRMTSGNNMRSIQGKQQKPNFSLSEYPFSSPLLPIGCSPPLPMLMRNIERN